MTTPAVLVEDVAVSFGGLHAVDGVTLHVEPGERRALIGPNGAGKTTLFNLIGGQLRPDAGRIMLHGRDVTTAPAHGRTAAGLGRTFQITNLCKGLSVRENALLAVVATIPSTRRSFWRAMTSSPAVVDRADGLLRRWELWDERDVLVSELAYGRQRVLEIVLALASDPRVLLLDEPTAGLSEAEARLMAELTQALPKELTLLLIEHDMEVAFAVADVVTVLENGCVLASGTPQEVQGNTAVIEAYLGGTDAA